MLRFVLINYPNPSVLIRKFGDVFFVICLMRERKLFCNNVEERDTSHIFHFSFFGCRVFLEKYIKNIITHHKNMGSVPSDRRHSNPVTLTSLAIYDIFNNDDKRFKIG